jgi:hypothetical protein
MEHLQILLTILALIGVALTIEKKTKITFSTSILYAVISISIFLYFGALLNYLEITASRCYYFNDVYILDLEIMAW